MATRPARIGGDEFVLLCGGLTDDEDIGLIAGRVLRAISETFTEDGSDLKGVTASIGVAVTDDPTRRPELSSSRVRHCHVRDQERRSETAFVSSTARVCHSEPNPNIRSI